MRLITIILITIVLCGCEGNHIKDSLKGQATLQNSSKEIKHGPRLIEWYGLSFESIGNKKLRHSFNERKVDAGHQVFSGRKDVVGKVIYSSNISWLAPIEPSWESYFTFSLNIQPGETYTLQSEVNNGIAILWVVNSKGDTVIEPLKKTMKLTPWSSRQNNK
ncbi:hypothetical protein [Grimontia indica]|uniref:hypothetical protein n=1 Tax=Grimontia indica TaxID=1056512 RepID=UPI0005865BF1|nr:hypothetical protein [Grimontia indica]